MALDSPYSGFIDSEWRPPLGLFLALILRYITKCTDWMQKMEMKCRWRQPDKILSFLLSCLLFAWNTHCYSIFPRITKTEIVSWVESANGRQKWREISHGPQFTVINGTRVAPGFQAGQDNVSQLVQPNVIWELRIPSNSDNLVVFAQQRLIGGQTMYVATGNSFLLEQRDGFWDVLASLDSRWKKAKKNGTNFFFFFFFFFFNSLTVFTIDLVEPKGLTFFIIYSISWCF